jgi:multisubunit Na+/H+ antiporter MnhC subunit
MKKQKAFGLIAVGFFLVLLGAVLPFLMVLKILESTFFLNFFSYGAQVTGVVLGLVGVVSQKVERN